MHAAGDVGGVHVAVLAATRKESSPPWRCGGTTFVGLWVPSLDAASPALGNLGCELLLAHEEREWGCRIVVADPDGRAIEVNQQDHCRPAEDPPVTRQHRSVGSGAAGRREDGRSGLQRLEDAELVSLRVGEHHPRRLGGLADRDA